MGCLESEVCLASVDTYLLYHRDSAECLSLHRIQWWHICRTQMEHISVDFQHKIRQIQACNGWGCIKSSGFYKTLLKYGQGVGRNQNCCLEVEKLAEDVVQMTVIHFAMCPSLENGYFCNYLHKWSKSSWLTHTQKLENCQVKHMNLYFANIKLSFWAQSSSKSLPLGNLLWRTP